MIIVGIGMLVFAFVFSETEFLEFRIKFLPNWVSRLLNSSGGMILCTPENWLLNCKVVFIYIYIYRYIYISSGHAENTDFPWLSHSIRPYHPLLLTGLLNCILCPCWSGKVGTSMCSVPWKNITDMFVFTPLAVSRMSCSSYLDGFRDEGRWLYRYCFVRCCFQNSSNIAHRILLLFPFSFFSKRFVSVYRL